MDVFWAVLASVASVGVCVSLTYLACHLAFVLHVCASG